MLQQVQTPQERALSRTRRSDDGDDLATMDVEVDVTQHVEGSETLLHVFDTDDGTVILQYGSCGISLGRKFLPDGIPDTTADDNRGSQCPQPLVSLVLRGNRL